MPKKSQNRDSCRNGGFTLIETLVASSVGVLVLAGTMTAFIWCVEQYTITAKIAWSQNEAMRSSTRIMGYIRNASDIAGMDTNRGTWVQLRFPDNSIGKLGYTNMLGPLRDGRLYVIRTNTTTLLVARGVTAVMDSSGFTQPIFRRINTNTLGVAYRVSEPVVTNGTVAANDDEFAAYVKFSGCLRNVATGQ